ncbi:MAG: hypothetical protein Ct9H300mP1_04810 [Planctomycetaceae bacterium]|nr:MAG: hypothetical protein Ct9H300mP1_04810 [Planctomycetaceae bacterium]
MGRLDSRFLGRLAGEHVLVMEFAEPWTVGRADRCFWARRLGRIPLFADGVLGLAGQGGFRTSDAGGTRREGELGQIGGELRVPRRDASPDGVSVANRQAAPGTTALRLRTNLEIYWDRLTVIRSKGLPGAWFDGKLKLAVADLRESGFMVRQLKEHFPGRISTTPNPGVLTPRSSTPRGSTPGSERSENPVGSRRAVAIFGPGEEIHVEFQAPESGPPKGWTRRLVLETVGWCKDMDLYTGTADGGAVARNRSPGRAAGPGCIADSTPVTSGAGGKIVPPAAEKAHHDTRQDGDGGDDQRDRGKR